MRLVWDQEVAGSNPVSPTIINTGTMKNVSQYLNSQEDCGCQEPVEEQIGSFLKGALGGVGKAIGSAALDVVGGPLGKAAVSGGMEAMQRRKEGAEMLDKEVIRCHERLAALQRQHASAKGNPDKQKLIQQDFDELKVECGKIEASKNVDKAEKALAGLRRDKAAAMRTKGASSFTL